MLETWRRTGVSLEGQKCLDNDDEAVEHGETRSGSNGLHFLLARHLLSPAYFTYGGKLLEGYSVR